MDCQVFISDLEPVRLPESSHGLQTEKRIVLHPPAALFAQPTREGVQNRIDIRGHMQPPPPCVVARIDDAGQLFWSEHALQPVHKLGATGTASEDSNHAAIRARPSGLVAALNFEASSPPFAATP